MTAAAVLLSRLEGVRERGAGQYSAHCPAHGDRAPSLSIREADDRVLVHCFAGCSPADVLAAVGLCLADLFDRPQTAADGGRHRRARFDALATLRAINHEALIVAGCAEDLARGVVLEDADRARLLVAAERIRSAMRIAS